jgi:hypothetical protein
VALESISGSSLITTFGSSFGAATLLVFFLERDLLRDLDLPPRFPADLDLLRLLADLDLLRLLADFDPFEAFSVVEVLDTGFSSIVVPADFELTSSQRHILGQK